MREKHRLFSKSFCWVAAPLMWGVPGLLSWLDLREGKITDEQFAPAGFRLLLMMVVMAFPVVYAWQDRRPKPPPVYRSTILD